MTQDAGLEQEFFNYNTLIKVWSNVQKQGKFVNTGMQLQKVKDFNNEASQKYEWNYNVGSTSLQKDRRRLFQQYFWWDWEQKTQFKSPWEKNSFIEQYDGHTPWAVADQDAFPDGECAVIPHQQEVEQSIQDSKTNIRNAESYVPSSHFTWYPIIYRKPLGRRVILARLSLEAVWKTQNLGTICCCTRLQSRTENKEIFHCVLGNVTCSWTKSHTWRKTRRGWPWGPV